MQQVATPPRAGRIFYSAAITLLMVAIAVACIQKQRESAVAIAKATGGNVQQIILDARHWGVLRFPEMEMRPGLIFSGRESRQDEGENETRPHFPRVASFHLSLPPVMLCRWSGAG